MACQGLQWDMRGYNKRRCQKRGWFVRLFGSCWTHFWDPEAVG